ncbi:protein-glutamate methylesterase/protein-glutamine glutaminase [Nitrospirillum iridis]|uniref:Protein-glutamate methylesterase/protein-glutamine glutaminase n=1 Tax=Nitrospirillum iridis TaxID=765888 RepID=A0A7X0B140_9PROT|nr:chemotaxis response regulator protein-glutamate methylesterase [Nitrospirillum iridis]MBB6253837.1 two-component system chemotaxis response regulator CheB [Nitrospirillum iridis]
MNDIPGRSQAAPPAAATTEPYRVMVVDDSAVIRGLLTRTLESDNDIRVVASVANGQMAVNTLRRQTLDVIVLDIEMPVMDGLTALPQLIAADPNVKIIMASTLTAKNADISLRALRAGASDYVTKPSSTRELTGADSFKAELVGKVRAFGEAARRADPSKGTPARPVAPRPAAAPTPAAAAGAVAPARVRLYETGPVTLRPAPDIRPDIIAIGSSTGGPQALFEVMSNFRGGLQQPIVITQHMPATFTTILAEHISRQCGIECAEAKDGEPIVGGRAYVAPGDNHFLLVPRNGVPTVQLTKDPPENFCRPAVDPMLRSIVKIYGRKVLAVILTGMGHDGRGGCDHVVQAGGMVVGQDEASSVVWGMPGAVATAGLCSSILPLKEIGPFIRKIALRTAA